MNGLSTSGPRSSDTFVGRYTVIILIHALKVVRYGSMCAVAVWRGRAGRLRMRLQSVSARICVAIGERMFGVAHP
jgi:hypothetical protein